MIRKSFAAVCILAGAIVSLSTAVAAAQAPEHESTKELSRAETEARVKADAARRFKLNPDDLKIVASAARIWPDAGLGCQARRGLLGSEPVSGFRIVVAAGERQLPYHTDRHGQLRVCLTPPRPLDPIR